MAKAGKPRINLPNEWFEKVEDSMIPELEAKANEIAGKVTQYDTGVLMRRDINGRPVAMIALKHPNGALIQARDATLTKAAASSGVDVHRYPKR